MRRACAAFMFVLVLAGISGGIWWWRHDSSLIYDPDTGFVEDPSSYLILGKSLSQGLGYRLINQPERAYYRLAPIGYPLVVAAVLKAASADDVTRAVIPIKFVNLLFFVGALGLLGYWWHRQQGVANGLWWWGLPLVAMNPLLLTLAGAVMSEVPYLLVSLAAILIVERLIGKAEGESRAMGRGEVLGIALALVVPFYFRTAGVSWMAAGLLFLFIRRRIGDAVRTLNWVLVFLAPWMLIMFSGYGRRTQAILAVALLAAALGSLSGRWAVRAAGLGAVIAGGIFALLYVLPDGPGGSYVAQAAGHGGTIGRVLAHGKMLALYIGAAMADGGPIPIGLNHYGTVRFYRAVGSAWADTGLVALVAVAALGWARRARERLGIVEVYIVIYALVLLASPWMELRYVAPILPVLFVYLLAGLRLLAQAIAGRASALGLARWDRAIVAAGGVILISLALASNQAGAAWARTPLEARDADVGGPGYWQAVAWVRDNTPGGSVVVSRYQGFTYLYGRRWSVRYPVDVPAEKVVREMLDRGVSIAIEDRMVKEALTAKSLGPALDYLRYAGLARVIHETPGPYGARIWRIEAPSQAFFDAGPGPIRRGTEALPAAAQTAGR